METVTLVAIGLGVLCALVVCAIALAVVRRRRIAAIAKIVKRSASSPQPAAAAASTSEGDANSNNSERALLERQLNAHREALDRRVELLDVAQRTEAQLRAELEQATERIRELEARLR